MVYGSISRDDRTTAMEWLALAAFIGGCLAVGFASSWAAGDYESAWFRNLAQPDWAPPDWVYTPVWSTLYALMGTAAWLVWRQWGWREAALPLGLFGLQLALNALWTPLFFGLRSPGLALVDAVALLLAVAATIAAFARRSAAAAWLMVPYLAWLGYATALNWSIWQLNP